MCGISGVVLPSDQVVDNSLLEKMGQSLHHRGPDNFSTLVAGNAGFAHNRLSILDLSEAGNQPFANDRYVLIYNGEIYNYLDIKKNLLAPDTPFRSTSDTEVLFHSLIQNGIEKTLRNINGMFAFAFYDRREGTLFLGRDRLGIKPLYWTQYAGGLYFGSEIKAVAAVLPIELDSIKTLYSLLLRTESRRASSLFKNVSAIEPGTYLQYQAGKSPVIGRYFSLVDLVDQDYHRSLGRLNTRDARELFLTHMRGSVQSMLMSDAPMGIFVSGGIDSSLVAAMVKDAGQDVNLFTANVLGEISEFSDTQALAQAIDLPLYDYQYAPEMLIRDLVQATWHNEAPVMHNDEAVAFSNVARLARQRGSKPVLTGEGADELFLGYQDMSHQSFGKLLTLPLDLLKRVYRLCPPLYRRIIDNAAMGQTSFLRRLIGEGPERKEFQAETAAALKFLSSKEARLTFETLRMIRTNVYALLHRNDRMGMIASIESRFPYLDEELLRFGVNLPLKWKLRWTTQFHDISHPFLKDKFVLRKGAEEYLPRNLTSNRKNPFPTYGLEYLRVGKGFFRDGYLSELLGLNRAAAENELDESRPRLTGHLVSLEVFGRVFGWRQSREEIDAHLQQYASMKIAQKCATPLMQEG